MKAVKAIGLASLVVVAIIAIAGVDAAAATTLCKENKNPCPVGQRYPEKETVLAGLEEKTTLSYEAVTGGGFFFKGTCEESSLSWSTTENRGPGAILFGTATSLLFGNCGKAMNSCQTVTAQNLPYNAELFPEAVMPIGRGELYLVNGASGVRKLKFGKCGFFKVDCTYEGGQMKWKVFGGNPAMMTIEWAIKSEGGNPVCGEEIVISASYTVAAPKPMWVEEEP